jgi:stage V sporulation protein K
LFACGSPYQQHQGADVPNDNATLLGATDALYATYEAIADALRAFGQDPIKLDTRRHFMTAMHYLAVYVCDADGQVSAAEATATSDIFWLDQLGWDDCKIRDTLAQHPEYIPQSLAALEDFARLLGEQADAKPGHNMVLETATLVLQTVLAADAGTDLEVERLTDITSRLRAAVSPVVVPDAPADEPVVPLPAAPAAADTETLTSILADLDRMVGLTNIKRQVETLTNLARVFAIRRTMGLPLPEMSFHLVFLGNPGTGKTTVARIVAKLYGKLGLLSKGQLIEVDRSGLVANYIGQTATKVEGVVNQAMGGVLFIDEAYALDGRSAQDFGHEAVATLIKAMEDHRDDLVVIAAGYGDEMHKFLGMNPGLRSRMCRDLVFDDYTPDEMVAIFRGMAEQAQYTLPPACDTLLAQVFGLMWEARGKDFANARDVRNLFERVIDAQANRLGSMTAPSQDDVTTITTEDLKSAAGAST